VSPTVRVASAASPIDVAGDVEAYTVIACVVGLAALILMLACVNAGNLLMAAAVTRRTEIATRLALGATRGRLWRQLISESVLLGGLAGVLGILFTLWIVPIAAAQIQLPPEVDLAPDSRVLAFVAGIALMCGLGAGLSPARHGARGHLIASLQGGGPHLAGMPSRFRTSFVGVQAAASMLLLVLAALLTRSALVTTRVDVGFDADRLLAVSLRPVQAGLDEAAYLRAALAAVEQVPGVERVSATRSAPFSFFGDWQRVERNGRRYALEVNSSDEAFLGAVGIVLLRGRTFTRDEVAREAPVAMLSARAAETLFPGADPIGQSLTGQPAGDRRRQEPATVIGVVADAVLSRPDDENIGIIYRPLKREGTVVTDQGLSSPPDLLVRVASPAAAAGIEEALRRVAVRVRPDVRFVRHTIDSWLAGTRMLAWTMAPPALLALVLAALGVFGVTAFATTQRLREVSIRMALGASGRDVARLLLRDSLRPVVIGLATGLGASLLVGRMLGSHFLWISPYDPLSLLLATAALLTCALVAVALPVHRVSKADPAGLLRV
jgi:predicted permease